MVGIVHQEVKLLNCDMLGGFMDELSQVFFISFADDFASNSFF